MCISELFGLIFGENRDLPPNYRPVWRGSPRFRHKTPKYSTRRDLNRIFLALLAFFKENPHIWKKKWSILIHPRRAESNGRWSRVQKRLLFQMALSVCPNELLYLTKFFLEVEIAKFRVKHVTKKIFFFKNEISSFWGSKWYINVPGTKAQKISCPHLLIPHSI